MKKVCVIANAGKNKAEEIAEQVSSFFCRRGLSLPYFLKIFQSRSLIPEN